MPGDRLNLSEFNNLVNKLDLDFSLTERKETNAPGEYFSLKSGDWQQPVFADMFRNEATDLSNPVFSKYFKVIPGSNSDILITFNTGDPFILTASGNQQSVFLICSYIDDAWTDFQYKGTFLPLLLRILLLGASNVDQLNQSLTIGQPAVFRFNLSKNYGELFIQSAAGDKTKLIRAPDSEGIILDRQSIQIPGNYKLYSDATELSTISVNAETRGLIPPYLDLQDMIEGLDHCYLVKENDDLVKMIREHRSGIELYNLLIFLVIITLFIEIILIKSIEGTKIL
jgi:hypothetical protein